MIETIGIDGAWNRGPQLAVMKPILPALVSLLIAGPAAANPDLANSLITDAATHSTPALLKRPAAMTTDSPYLAANDAPILPFEISVADADIEDLKRRLANTRWPDQIAGPSREYGTDVSYLLELVDYCQNEFDSKKQELELNQFDQF